MNEEAKPKRSFREILAITGWTITLALNISRPLYFGLLIGRIAQTLLPILEALVGSIIVGNVVTAITQKQSIISQDLIILIIAGVVISILRSASYQGYEYLKMRFNYAFTQKIFPLYISRMVGVDMQHHEDPKFQTLLDKIEDVMNWKGISSMDRIISLIASIIGLTTLGYIFAQINQLFIIILILPAVINFFINRSFGKDIYYIWDWAGEENRDAVNAYYTFKNDESKVQEAKIYGFGDYIAERFKRLSQQYLSKIINLNNKKYLFLFLVIIIESVVFGALQLWLIDQILLGLITIQAYTFYLQSIGQVSNTFISIQDHVSTLYDFGQYMVDFKTFLELEDVVKKPKPGIIVPQKSPAIEFDNVSFAYPRSNNQVLKDLSFKINPGEKVALVGKNGAGKSTLIKLLARFYDPLEGSIQINSTDLKQLDLESYYKLWGILLQDFSRYWFSLRENIGIGNLENITDLELIKQAASKVGLNSILPKLPKQYETMLSRDFKDGVELSGGEWQKVGLARGLFAEPKLIILDEPTSALDALAEQKVFDEIQQLSKDTTMIIVSHRFATVRNADRILVLDNGTIAENGNHETLMQNKGLYFEMFTTQAKGYQ